MAPLTKPKPPTMTAAKALRVSSAPTSGKMLKSGETRAAAAPARAADSPKVASATRCTSTPTTAHASRFWDMARIALPSLVRVTNHSSPAKTATAATSTSGRCQASRTPPTWRWRTTARSAPPSAGCRTR